MSIVIQLEQLHEKYAQHMLAKTNLLPQIIHDSDWPSPCEVGAVNEQGFIQWQAVRKEPATSLNDLANALGVEFPQALSTYYGAFFAGPLVANIDEHNVELLQVWNEEDYQVLQQNITGHILMKQKLKQSPTVFIGLTEQDDLLISVLLDTGEVCLEYVGKQPHHVLASDLETFIGALSV